MQILCPFYMTQILFLHSTDPFLFIHQNSFLLATHNFPFLLITRHGSFVLITGNCFLPHFTTQKLSFFLIHNAVSFLLTPHNTAFFLQTTQIQLFNLFSSLQYDKVSIMLTTQHGNLSYYPTLTIRLRVPPC